VTQDVDLAVAAESVDYVVQLFEDAGHHCGRFTWLINFVAV
jgi:hypothetical protein